MSNKKWRSGCNNHLERQQLQHLQNYDETAEDLFPIKVPEYLLNKIDTNNSNDPILLQVLPQHNEHHNTDEFSDDPVGDMAASPTKGVIHKYHGRVLLITNGQCAVNCRYCFRRNFAYHKNYASSHNWSNAVHYIQHDETIHEVILSGGDPLMLSVKSLQKLTSRLQNIPHIKTLRIHTRVPLVAPDRINDTLLNWLNNVALKKVMVVHCNHSHELSNDLKKVFIDLKNTNTLLLNQSVLLKNINDDSETLSQLSHRLFEFGILPYYLNQLDKAKGTQHFEVSKKSAINIHQQLLSLLPGYLVPKLVEEISGKKNKSPIF